MTINDGFKFIKTILENKNLIVEIDKENTISVIINETIIGYRLLELHDTNKKIIDISYKKLNFNINYKFLVIVIVDDVLTEEFLIKIIDKSINNLENLLF